MFIVNMDGSDKAKIIIIGRAEHPRCLTHGGKVKLWYKIDIDYYHQNKAWMDGFIFQKGRQKWNQELVEKTQKNLSVDG